MSEAKQIATTLLRKHELGGNEHLAGTLICDKCGKPWKECSESRFHWALWDWPKIDSDDWMKAINENPYICPGGSPTSGIGHNWYARKLSDEATNFIYEHDDAPENEKEEIYKRLKARLEELEGEGNG